MEDEKKDFEMTLHKLLAGIFCVAGIVGILSLIWAKWVVMQLCATFVFLSVVCMLVLPEDW